MGMSELVPQRGHVASLTLEVVRELVVSDLPLLAQGLKAPGPPPLQRVRAIHHRQALLLAQGKTIVEVAVIVGTTPTRLQQLQRDPAFINLMAYYQDQVISVMLEDAQRIETVVRDNAELAVMEINERLSNPDKIKNIPLSELRKIQADALDRTILPTKAATSGQPQAPTNITLTFGTPVKGPETQRETQREAPPLIDITPEGEEKE